MTLHIINSGLKIRTHFEYPAIPVRDFDWSAVTDDYDGADDCNDPIGRGPTEQAAIDDLMVQIEDEADGGGQGRAA